MPLTWDSIQANRDYERMNTMKLRSFLYLNTKLLNDYLSAIDGYVHNAETRTETNSSQKTAGIEGAYQSLRGNDNLKQQQTLE